jgi:hypothetical protein
MLRKTPHLFVIAIISFAWSASGAAQEHYVPSGSNELFGKYRMLFEGGPFGQQILHSQLQKDGFKSLDANKSFWRFRDAQGSLLLQAYYLPEKTRMSLNFSIANPTAIPSTLFSTLISRTTRTRLENGDSMLFILPDEEIGVHNGYRGSVSQELVIALRNGAVLETRMSIEWTNRQP